MKNGYTSRRISKRISLYGVEQQPNHRHSQQQQQQQQQQQCSPNQDRSSRRIQRSSVSASYEISPSQLSRLSARRDGSTRKPRNNNNSNNNKNKNNTREYDEDQEFSLSSMEEFVPSKQEYYYHHDNSERTATTVLDEVDDDLDSPKTPSNSKMAISFKRLSPGRLKSRASKMLSKTKKSSSRSSNSNNNNTGNNSNETTKSHKKLSPKQERCQKILELANDTKSDEEAAMKELFELTAHMSAPISFDL